MKEIRNKFNILLMFLMASFTWFFTACDDTIEGSNEGGIAGFPTDTLFFEVVPGDTVLIPINVDYKWSIYSSEPWCLVNGESQSDVGKAGEYIVKFIVGDLGNLYVKDEASITLNMNDESRVIARITRRATMKYTMKVSDDERELADGESIVIGATGEKNLYLDADFDLDQLRFDNPKWLEVQRNDTILTLNVTSDSLRYAINRAGDSLRFFKDSTFYRSFHVQNKGQEIKIEIEKQWGLKVSAAGETYTTSTSQSANVFFNAPVEATINSLRGYQLWHVNYDTGVGCVIIPESKSWLKVEDDRKGHVKVSFERNTGNMRTAYLFALPIAFGEDANNISSYLFETSAEDSLQIIRNDAEEYLVAEFIQEADESSMKVINALNGWKYLMVEREVEQKWIDVATAKGVPANKIFRADLKSGASFLLNPLLDEEAWNPAKETIEVDTIVDTKGDSVIVEKVVYKDGIAVYGESGTQYIKDVHFEAEPTKMEEEEGDYMLVQFKAKYDIKEEYYIIYFFAEDKYLKALVVWNYWE